VFDRSLSLSVYLSMYLSISLSLSLSRVLDLAHLDVSQALLIKLDHMVFSPLYLVVMN